MTRSEVTQAKVHFKGKDEDFVVFVDDVKAFNDWKTDKSIPLTQVVGAFKIFITHKHGAQGTMDSASKATLDNEFGTHVDDEVIKQILEKGSIQESDSAERQGSTNDSKGAMAGH
ncbi:SDO1-like protein [Lachnellula suecica]|uniref:SDO1-like protein n=1 Tax=Lachnellula suecica TaxID=602035 RepID=A0A8T9CCK7_9HELO|nr:SDO1-like protein [Lachnellula suecica]